MNNSKQDISRSLLICIFIGICSAPGSYSGLLELSNEGGQWSVWLLICFLVYRVSYENEVALVSRNLALHIQQISLRVHLQITQQIQLPSALQ